MAGSSFLDHLASQLGVPYQWGGDTPGRGFDCSGLVMWAASQVGVELPHLAADQERMSTPIAQNQTQPGDLAFFEGTPGNAGHVGVCWNQGCTVMLDAPHSGAKIRIEDVWGPSWNPRFGRIPALVGGAPPQVAQLTSASTAGPPGASDLADPATFAAKTLAWMIDQTITNLLGGRSPAEVVVRGLEVIGGGLLLAGGIVLLVVCVTDRPARGARRTYRTASARARGIERNARGIRDERDAAALSARADEREQREGTSAERARAAGLYRPSARSGERIGQQHRGPGDRSDRYRLRPGETAF